MKIAPAEIESDVFGVENRAGDVVAELTNTTNKLNSRSRLYQAEVRIA